MTNLDAAADRVCASFSATHGKVLDRVDNVMMVELPADTIPLINCPVR